MCSYYLPAKIMSITFCVQHHANLSVFTLLLLLIVDISLRPWYIAIQGYRLLPMTVCNKEGWEWGYEYLLWPAYTAPTSLFRSVDRMLQHSAHHINTVIIRWLQQRNSWLTGCCHHCNICVLLREKKTWIHRMALKGWVGLLWSEREVVGLQWSEREKEGLLIVDISLRSWYIALQGYLASFPGSSLRQYATKKSGNEGMDTWCIYCTDFPLQISGFHVPTFSSPYT